MNFDLARGTIFLGVTGSHAYGMATETSDVDVRGLAIPPPGFLYGFNNVFEQADVMPEGYAEATMGKHAGGQEQGLPRSSAYQTVRAAIEDGDCTVMDVRKFCKLAIDANPNVLELLFLPERCVLLRRSPMEELLVDRDHFLSTKVRHTFSGYAHAQLKRIRTHRAWLLNPPSHQPTRTEFGLKEGGGTIGKEQLGVINARIRKMEDAWGGRGLTKDQVAQKEEAMALNVVVELDLSAELIPLVIAERRYAAACTTWSQYQSWKTNRNEKRSELEQKYGYDTKHGAHLVRLMRMGYEVLTTGKLAVDRREAGDAEELLAIRRGRWSFEDVESWAALMEVEMEKAYDHSPLPHKPDRVRADLACVRAVERGLRFLHGTY